jgi:hypothetical protein
MPLQRFFMKAPDLREPCFYYPKNRHAGSSHGKVVGCEKVLRNPTEDRFQRPIKGIP